MTADETKSMRGAHFQTDYPRMAGSASQRHLGQRSIICGSAIGRAGTCSNSRDVIYQTPNDQKVMRQGRKEERNEGKCVNSFCLCEGEVVSIAIRLIRRGNVRASCNDGIQQRGRSGPAAGERRRMGERDRDRGTVGRRERGKERKKEREGRVDQVLRQIDVATVRSVVFDDFNEASDGVLACYFICVEVPRRNLHDLITA